MPVSRPAPARRLVWSFALSLTACATRAVPHHYPKTSPASPDAALPVAADVTSALRDDPGTSAGSQVAPAAPPPAQHGDHHHAH